MSYYSVPYGNYSVYTYDLSSHIPQEWRGWNDYNCRLSRYEVYEGYYHNLAYHTIMSYSQTLKVVESLYKHVRGVYNPVKRLVEAYVAKTYGGMLDIHQARKGVIPIETEDDRVRTAITTLWKDSQWGQKKSLYTRYGAKVGDSFIKVVDDIQKGQVRLEVLDPAKIKELEVDPDGTITKVVIFYYLRYEQRNYSYQETITPDRFEIESEYEGAFPLNGRNERVTEWDNEYGFVPMVHAQHMDVGMTYGAPAAHGSLHKINELNDLASILNDGMRRQVNLPMVSINAKIGALDFGSDQSSNTTNPADKPAKDTMDVINLVGSGNNQPDLKTLPPTIDIANGLQNIVNIQTEIENDCPELALHRLRDSGNLTAPGVRSAYDDAIAKFQEARGNYDTQLIAAQKMALAIGGFRNYAGYQGFNLLSLENGQVDHQIQERPIINDSMSLTERADYTLRGLQQNAPKVFFTKIGWSEDEADDMIASAQTQNSQFMMTSPFASLATTPPPQDNGQTPQDAFDTRLNAGVNESDIIGANDLLQQAV